MYRIINIISQIAVFWIMIAFIMKVPYFSNEVIVEAEVEKPIEKIVVNEIKYISANAEVKYKIDWFEDTSNFWALYIYSKANPDIDISFSYWKEFIEKNIKDEDLRINWLYKDDMFYLESTKSKEKYGEFTMFQLHDIYGERVYILEIDLYFTKFNWKEFPEGIEINIWEFQKIVEEIYVDRIEEKIEVIDDKKVNNEGSDGWKITYSKNPEEDRDKMLKEIQAKHLEEYSKTEEWKKALEKDKEKIEEFQKTVTERKLR